MLNKGQQKAKDLIEQGHNVCISGSAGVGKSYLMREITTPNTVVCAPTGSAALLVGGVTAASLFGIPIGVCLDSDKFGKSQKLEELFASQKVDRIIFDEISQCRSDQLSLIDARMRKACGRDVPFGGVQMVFVGDFYQLPPIVGKTERKVFNDLYKSPWAFDSMSWQMADVKTHMLTEIMRQEDVLQQSLLTSIRTKDDKWIESVNTINEISSQRPLDAIYLASYNKTVDLINNTRFKEVKGKQVTYTAKGSGFKPREMPVAQKLILKVGCKVLIKANHKDGLYVNGTTGTVVGLEPDSILVESDEGRMFPVEPFKWSKQEYVMGLGGLERKEVASFKQFPVKLGYSVSLSASQGCTLGKVNIDFGSGAFAAGMAYMGLSRVKDLKDMHVIGGLDYSDVIVDERVKEFYKGVL